MIQTSDLAITLLVGKIS